MCEDGAGGGCVCRRGLRRGAVTRPFHAADLLRALDDPDTNTVYADVDGAGYVVAGGARGRDAGNAGGGGAALCVRATLAPHVRACDALLTAREPDSAHPHQETVLQLRVCSGRAPHDALRVWPDARLLATLGVPHLTPINIRGEKEYRCSACDTHFVDPNPLKVHLYLGCARPNRAAFWRRVAAALLQVPTPPAPLHPARLEALAAEWGRARGAASGTHACLYCGKLYSRKYGLKIHIRTHTGYRPLRCRLCARAFGDPSNLNKHVRLHAARGDSPLQGAQVPALRCGVCGKAQARRRDLERHLRTHAHATR